MTLTTTDYKHIQLTDQNVPIIEGTTMKVVELITSHQVYGWSPEELHFQYPHITLSQIYSALAYYWDHKTALDAEMQRRYEFATQSQQVASDSKMAQKLQTIHRLRTLTENSPQLDPVQLVQQGRSDLENRGIM